MKISRPGEHNAEVRSQYGIGGRCQRVVSLDGAAAHAKHHVPLAVRGRQRQRGPRTHTHLATTRKTQYGSVRSGCHGSASGQMSGIHDGRSRFPAHRHHGRITERYSARSLRLGPFARLAGILVLRRLQPHQQTLVRALPGMSIRRLQIQNDPRDGRIALILPNADRDDVVLAHRNPLLCHGQP